MIAVSGVTMVTQTANPVTVVAWGAQTRTLALGPVAVRRMLKVKTVVVANLVSSTCKKIIRKAVRSVSAAAKREPRKRRCRQHSRRPEPTLRAVRGPCTLSMSRRSPVVSE